MALPDTDAVVACIQDVDAAVQSIAQFKSKTVFIYDENDLADKIKGIRTFPAAGIVYGGLRKAFEASNAAHKATARLGASTKLTMSILVISQPEVLVNADTKTPSILLLTALRDTMLARRSPSGHFWEFEAEAPAALKGGMTFWVQQWSTPLQLQVKR